MVAHADAAERQVRAVDALGKGDNVGDDRRGVAKAKELARAAKARHDLVAHEQDAVLVAQRAQALEVAFGRRQHAVGARHRLDKDGRDRVPALGVNHLVQLRAPPHTRGLVGAY